MYVREHLKAKTIANHTTSELIATQIKNRNITVFCVYKPPNVNADKFYEDIVDMTTMHSDQTTVVVAGDTNMNILEQSKRQKVEHYGHEMNLQSHVLVPTHKEACIDHIMVTKGTIVTNIRVLSPIEKWHSVITCEIDTQTKESKGILKQIISLNWRKAQWNAMEIWLREQKLLKHMCSATSVEECWKLLKSTCNNATELFVPKQKVKQKHKIKSWIKNATFSTLKRKNKLYKKWQKTKSQRDRSKFEKLRKTCKKQLMKDKQKWIEEAFNSENTNRFWSEVRKLNKPQTKIEIPELITNGHRAISNTEKAEILRSQFHSIWSQSIPSINLESGPGAYQECPIKWTYDEMRRLNPKKATGPDGISPKILRNMAAELAPCVAHLITRTWYTGDIPQDWKKAIVIPIPKKGNSSNPEDYRPISLTCVLSKIAERFVNNQITEEIESGLPAQQYGFRKGRSTNDSLIHAEHKIMEAMEECKKTSTRVVLMSFDIQKAFDTIPHNKLIDHLRNDFNLPLNAKRWLLAFLTERTFCVRVGTDYSRWSPTTCGVPQGTVLGPILFNAATSGLKNLELTKGTEIIIYADDLLLIKKVIKDEDEKQLQMDCDKINLFYEQESLKINGSKTQLLITSVSPGGATRLQTPPVINGNQIMQVETLKYLGVVFDERITFTKHASLVARKARKMIGAVGTVLRKWKMFKQIKRIYLCCIRPTILYGIAATYPRTAIGRSTLERVNKLAAQMTANKYHTDYEEILKVVNWDTINWLSIKEQLRIMHHYTAVQKSEKANQWTMMIEPESARRSSRLSNDTPYRVIGKEPRLTRTMETTIRQMITLWNRLPTSATSLSNKETFLAKINSEEIRNSLLNKNC